MTTCVVRALFVVLLLYGVSENSGALPFDNADSTLRELCETNKPNIELTKVSEVQQVIRALIEDESGEENKYNCPPPVREAVLALGPVLLESNLRDVCNLEFVNKIGLFHRKYIATSSPDHSHLPISLRAFFLALGLKLSSNCKRTMVTDLTLDTNNLLDDQDRSTIQRFASNEDSMFNQIMGNRVTDYDDIILASDLTLLSQPEGGDPHEPVEPLYIQAASSQVIGRLKGACERKFRPIYERRIMPLIKLSHLGYNYRGEMFKRELEELRDNELIGNWYKIVYLCELFKNIESVEPAPGDRSAEIRLVTREEIEEQHLKLVSESESMSDQVSGLMTEEDMVVALDDLVLDRSDRDLIWLIKKFDQLGDESRRVRAKLLGKLAGWFKKMLLGVGGNTKLVMRSITEQQEQQHQQGVAGGEASIVEGLVRSLDEHVARELGGPEQVDSQVSGLSKVVKRHYHNSAYNKPGGLGNRVGKKRVLIPWSTLFWRLFGVTLFIVGLVTFFGTLG